MSEQPKSEITSFTGAILTESSKVNVTEQIERIVVEKKIDYISAAVELAKMLDWDPSWMAPYISGAIKEKLRVEGEAVGLLKRTSKPAVLFD